MTPFLHGFTDELLKIAAFPQHESDVEFDSGSPVGEAMAKTQGAAAKVGLKSGGPVQTPTAPKKRAPTPLTTPNAMVGYIGGK